MATTGTQRKRLLCYWYQPLSVPVAAYWEIGFPVASQYQACYQPILLGNRPVNSRFVEENLTIFKNSALPSSCGSDLEEQLDQDLRCGEG